MKRKISKFIISLFFVLLMMGCSNSKNGDNNQLDEAKNYLGKWGVGRATLDVTNENDKYMVNILWASSASEYHEWNYDCEYAEDTKSLECVGKKSIKELNEDDEAKVTVVYNDGKASFVLKDGNITWDDKKEDMGKDMLFTK